MDEKENEIDVSSYFSKYARIMHSFRISSISFIVWLHLIEVLKTLI